MRPEVKRARKQFENNRPKPDGCCKRCGMSQSEHNERGRQSLQIHHTMALKDHGEAGNDPATFDTLCYWCHKEWHGWWESLSRPYAEFMDATPFLQQLESGGITP